MPILKKLTYVIPNASESFPSFQWTDHHAQISSTRLGMFVVDAAGVRMFALISPFLFMIVFISDNCKKFGLVFDNVVGIVEVINSRDIQIQVNTYLKNKDGMRKRASRKKKPNM